MTFEEWWDKERKSLTQDYLMLGPQAIMKTAKRAWEASIQWQVQPGNSAYSVTVCDHIFDQNDFCMRCGYHRYRNG